MMNVVLIFVVITGTNYVYSRSRSRSRNVLGLAHLGMAPKYFQYADELGGPWPSLTRSMILGRGLA
jgi:amino acid transporter